MPFAVVEQHLQEMLGRELLVALAERVGLGRLDEALRPLGVFLDIHASDPFRPGPATRSVEADGQSLDLAPGGGLSRLIWCGGYWAQSRATERASVHLTAAAGIDGKQEGHQSLVPRPATSRQSAPGRLGCRSM